MSTLRERSISYRDGLLESLKDPEEAVAYLNACLKDGDQELILIAWCNVLAANPAIAATIQVIQVESQET